MDKQVEKQEEARGRDEHGASAQAAESQSRHRMSQEAMKLDEYKIGDKVVKLPAGFQRNEPPEERKVFPTPDLSKHLVPKNDVNATSGEAPRSLPDKITNGVGEKVGDFLGWFVKKGAKIADEQTKDKPWEEFGEDRSLPGRLIDLSRPVNRRNKLEEHNLESAYPADERSGKISKDLSCPKGSEVSRSPDGTCNDLKDPAMGAAGTRFQYNTKPDLRYEINDPPLMDAAKLLDRKEFKELPVLNLLGVASLQGNVHDWMDHGKHQTGRAMHTIPLPEDHPIRKNHGQTEMKIPQLLIDGTRTASDDAAKIRQTYQNTVTHWWDASEIYGSDQETANRLREHKNGKMRLSEDGLLPIGPQGVPDTGFNQNWNPLLEVIHTLYVREHNSIADMLTKSYPQAQFAQWKDKLPEILKPMFGEKLPETLTDAQYDEFIYSRARLINAAEKAKIHTIDWTPVALNNKTMTNAMIDNYGQEKIGWREHVNEHEIGGIWGNKTHMAGKPYAMEEDFVQSYQQMHGLVPDNLKIYDHKSGKEIGDVPLGAALQANSRKVIDAAGFDNILYSMAIEKAGQITAGNHPNFMRDLNIRGNYVDLAAVDILRGREKQLPRYNEYLRQMHEKPVANFEELVPNNVELREAIRKVYNNDIEKVDTVIGSLAEWPDRTPKTMGFSASTFLEFILMASRRVQADRFYTRDFRPEIYTPEGIERIRSVSGLRDLIERNAPELKAAVATRQSSFHPLGTEPIPLNNSGIDELPTSDLQAQVAAFDTNRDGEVSFGEYKSGFKAMGYGTAASYYNAIQARSKFGTVISKLKPESNSFYKADGNLDLGKVDGLFNGKASISGSDLSNHFKSAKTSENDRFFIESGMTSLGKQSISREEFIKIMKGNASKEKIWVPAGSK